MNRAPDSRRPPSSARLAWLAALASVLALGLAAQSPNARGATSEARAPARHGAAQPALIYDKDYPYMHYSGRATHNPVAHLKAALASGRVRLEFRPPRGYLDSLLKALKISPTSQVTVFSKTSLQTSLIGPATPRAIYFNDDTYVAWIYGTTMIEINTMDSALGAVFYTLGELPQGPAKIRRRMFTCLDCHDTFSLQGGGVPDFLFLSTYHISGGKVITDGIAEKTFNSTPMRERWGGWYVTGRLGGMLDLGNILPPSSGRAIPLWKVSRANVPNLRRFFDTKPYLTDKSDVVALLVLENQVDIHNLVIRANYKSRMILERHSPGSSTKGLDWNQLSPQIRKRFASLLEPLVRGMLYVGAAKLPAPVRGNSGYAQWFQAQGPFDSRGRSLRDLDLRTRVFKYPLSFLIYSKGFDELIPSAKQYVYARLYQVLSGRDSRPAFAGLSARRRTAALEILEATKPDFARVARKAERTGRTILAPPPQRAGRDMKATLRRSGPKATSSTSAGATMPQTRINAKA